MTRRHLPVLATALALTLGACGTYGAVKGLLVGESGSGADRHLTGFVGGVAADEPQAAIVGRDILRRGGNAAETLARHGFPVSHLLGADLAVVGEPLLADPGARAAFTTPDGLPVGENDTLIEGNLGNTLEQVRLVGPGALVSGPVAAAFAAGAASAGGGVTADDLRQIQAALVDPVTLAGAGHDKGLNIAFTPLPADGGIAAARAFRLLEGDPEAATAALAESQATASYARTTGATASAILDAQLPTGTLPPLPASTSFVVVDRSGGAVACDLTMGNLFGTGRIAGSTGIVLAASPADHPAPLLPLAIAYDRASGDFRAAVAASGQNEAAAAAAEALANTLRTRKPISEPVTDAGRVNVIACPDLLPGGSTTCGGATDSRGTGLALGNN